LRIASVRIAAAYQKAAENFLVGIQSCANIVTGMIALD